MAFGRQNQLGMGYSKPYETKGIGASIGDYITMLQERDKLNTQRQSMENTGKYYDSIAQNQRDNLEMQERIAAEARQRTGNFYEQAIKENKLQSPIDIPYGDIQDAQNQELAIGKMKAVYDKFTDQAKLNNEIAKALAKGKKPVYEIPAPDEGWLNAEIASRSNQFALENPYATAEEIKGLKDVFKQQALSSYYKSNAGVQTKGGTAIPPEITTPSVITKAGGRTVKKGDTIEDAYGDGYRVVGENTVVPVKTEIPVHSTFDSYVNDVSTKDPKLADSLRNLDADFGIDQFNASKVYNFLLNTTGNEKHAQKMLTDVAKDNTLKHGGISTLLASVPVVSSIVNFFDSANKKSGEPSSEAKRKTLVFLSRLNEEGRIKILKDEGMKVSPKSSKDIIPSYNFQIVDERGRPYTDEQLKQIVMAEELPQNKVDTSKKSTTQRYLEFIQGKNKK